MSQLSASHPLVERLSRLRGRVRLVVSLHGIGLVVAGAVAAILVLAVGDWLVHFSVATRALLLMAFVGTLAVVVYKKLVAPLSTKLTDQFLASRVENNNKQLADELISAVHFVQSGTINSNAIAARHVETTAAKTAGVRFEDSLDFRRANRTLAVAAILLLVALLIGFAKPEISKLLFGRWVAFSPTAEWPRLTNVEFAWETADGKQPEVLPIGEQFLVRAKVTRGGYAGMRTWLYSKNDSQKMISELMTYQQAASSKETLVYERSIEPVGNSAITLRPEAGDHNEAAEVRIRLAPRPVISELSAAITPPAYVKNVDPTKPVAPVMVDLLTQSGRAVEGASVALRIKSSKPFLIDDQGRPNVRFFDQVKDTEIKLANATMRLLEPNVAQVTFPAKQTLQVRTLMRDADGFENRVGGTLSMEVIPDAMPTVVITEPRRMAERLEGGELKLEIQANDDMGLDGLKLVAERFDAKPGEAAVFTTDLQWTETTVDAAVGTTMGKANYTWDLTPLKLAAGTRLSFYVMVQDNFEVSEKSVAQPLPRMMIAGANGMVRHDWVKSAPLALQIRTAEDIAERNRRELNEVRERIMNLKKQQDQTKTQVDAIEKTMATSGVSTNQQKAQLSELAQTQAQQAAAANAIQQRVEQIKKDLAENKLGETDMGKLAQEVAAGMKDVGTNNMPKAVSELSKAAEAAGGAESGKPEGEENKDPAGKDPAAKDPTAKDPNAKKDPAAKDPTAKSDPAGKSAKGEPSEGSPEAGKPSKGSPQEGAQQASKAAKGASEQQKEAIEKMDKMIAELGKAGDIDSAKAKLKEIQKEQDKVTQEAREAMAPIAGKKPEDLSKDLKEKLDQLAGKQKDLANQTAALTEDMKKAAGDAAKAGDPASAESLSKAAEAGESSKASESQSKAGDAMSKNQSSKTAGEQAAASEGLKKMMEELEKQDQRQLEQLSRELAALLADLQKLVKEEKQLQTETTAAGDKAGKKVLATLGNQQGRTHQNTIVAQKKAESTKDSQKAANDIRDAADAMGLAATSLFEANQPAALPPEVLAIASLEEAIKKLEKQKQEVDNKLKEKDLAAFIKQYEGIRAAQAALKGQSDAMEAKRLAAADKQLERIDTMKLAELATTQAELKKQIGEISGEEKIKEFEVVLWMNGQIETYMDKSRDLMSKAKTDRALASSQQTAIDRITSIIEALKEEKDKPKEFENESGGGGGGGGGGKKPPLVPPSAQLKLLKAMQDIVNGQTKSVNREVVKAGSPDAKAELKQEASHLGKQQGEIKDLADKVMEKLKQ